jgi:hypothetical protein
VRTEFTHQDPGPSPHPCNAPDLSPIEFLQAIYRDRTFPLSTRIDAARALLPYTEPRPTNSFPPRCKIIIGGLGPYDHGSVTEDAEQINANSQSKSRIRPDNPQPSSETPGPTNIETNSYPATLIDYSTPPTPAELQEIKAAINALRPDLAHLPVPEFHLCPCGHWITGEYDCCRRERSKLN